MTMKYCVGAPAVALVCTVFWMADSPAQERLPIVRHDAELRSCPALECRVVARLPILSFVHVHDKVPARSGQVDQGHWAHVATGRLRRMGWLTDGDVGYPDSFAPVQDWPVESFGYCMGEYCPEFRFTRDGHFTVMSPACFDGLCPDPPDEAACPPGTEKTAVGGWVHCLWSGRLHRAGDAVRAGGADSREFLYFDERGRLCADAWTCKPRAEN